MLLHPARRTESAVKILWEIEKSCASVASTLESLQGEIEVCRSVNRHYVIHHIKQSNKSLDK